MTAERLDVPAAERSDTYFAVALGDRIISVIPADVASNIATADPSRRLGEVAGVEFTCIASNATLLELLARMRSRRVTLAVVLSPNEGDGAQSKATPQVVGVLTKDHLVSALAEGMELFAD